MQAVILCGGLGTRLREETEFRPKPMVEIGGKPILWHIMKGFAHAGVTEFVLCTGYKGHMIREYFLNYEAMNNDFTIKLGSGGGVTHHGGHDEDGWSVTVLDTGDESNTGERVRRAAPHIRGDRFIVTYGDAVSDVDLSRVVAFHEDHGKLATLTTVKPLTRFGIVDLDEGSVVRFREKPQSEDWVSAGYFVFERAVLDYLDPGCVLEQAPLERLAKEGQIAAFPHEGFWQPMDTYREMVLLSDLWRSGEAPWKVWA